MTPEPKVAPMVIPARPVRTIDRPITFTVFPNEKAQAKAERRLSFVRLAAGIAKRTADSKELLPFLKLAIFGDERSRRNCLRTNTNVRCITGVEGDHDAGDMTLEKPDAGWLRRPLPQSSTQHPQTSPPRLAGASCARCRIHTRRKPERRCWRVSTVS